MVEGPRLGPKIRALRRREELTQAQLAERLGISASYLNLIENNRRTLSAPLLIRLAQLFHLDIAAFAQDDQGQMIEDLLEVLADPLFEPHQLTQAEVKELAADNPNIASALMTLYRAFRSARDSAGSLAERIEDETGPIPAARTSLPSEEVDDFIQRSGNYFPELEDAAELLWKSARLDPQEVRRGLIEYLESVHGVLVRVEQEAMMQGAVRRFDDKNHVLRLGEVLPPRSRNFQLAYQIAFLDHQDVLDRLTRDQGLSTEAARRMAQVGLANYFAGAVMMPYDRFRSSAQALRYDIELLGHRFRTSFEQVCHRLTSLKRPGAEGIPFHMVRIDVAGNISKRFSASGFKFARFSGACPRWSEHTAFSTPGLIRRQISEMPDGTRYFSLARTVRDELGGYHAPHALHAVGLGCELRFAKELIYADGMDLEDRESIVPVGVTCRTCERIDCEQRAFPSMLSPLEIDPQVRGRSFYVAVPNRERNGVG